MPSTLCRLTMHVNSHIRTHFPSPAYIYIYILLSFLLSFSLFLSLFLSFSLSLSLLVYLSIYLYIDQSIYFSLFLYLCSSSPPPSSLLIFIQDSHVLPYDDTLTLFCLGEIMVGLISYGEHVWWKFVWPTIAVLQERLWKYVPPVQGRENSMSSQGIKNSIIMMRARKGDFLLNFS